MFCGECGQKNKEGSKFCENCGSPLNGKVEKKKNSTKVTKKSAEAKTETAPVKQSLKERWNHFSKNQKIGLVVAAVVVVLVFLFVMVGKSITSPTRISDAYFKALSKEDYAAVYDYMGLQDSDFVSKDILKKKAKKEKKDTKISNFKRVTTTRLKELIQQKGTSYNTKDLVGMQNSDLRREYVYEYTKKGSSEVEYASVVLIKSEKKKWLFFDTWEILDNDFTRKNYMVSVPKGAKVSLDGKTIAKKYLNKSKSSSRLDVYVLPEVFNLPYEVKVTFADGLETSESITPSYSGYSLSDITLSSKSSKALTNSIEKGINTIYQNIIAKKDFEAVKKEAVFSKMEQADYKKLYENIKTSLEFYKQTLSKFEITKTKISSLSYNSKGYLEARINLEYDYKMNYVDFLGDAQEKEASDSKTIYMTFEIEKNNFYIHDCEYLMNYFSRY